MRLALTDESVFVVEGRELEIRKAADILHPSGGDLVRFPRSGGPGQKSNPNPVSYALEGDGRRVVFEDLETQDVVVQTGVGMEENRLGACGLMGLEATALEGTRIAWIAGGSLRLADGLADACQNPISPSATGLVAAMGFACADERLYYLGRSASTKTGSIGLLEQSAGGLYSETSSWPLDGRPVDIAIVGDALFVSVQDEGTVVALQTPCGSGNGTSALVTLAKGLRTPWGIAADEHYVYVAEKGTVDAITLRSTTKDGRISAIDRATGEVQVIAESLDCPLRVAVDDKAVYWIEQGTVGQATGRLAYVEKTGQ